jgi:hypothetical protein
MSQQSAPCHYQPLDDVAASVRAYAAQGTRRDLDANRPGPKLSDEDRCGLTALFWSNINPYGTFGLDMDKRLDLRLSVAVPQPGSAEAAMVTSS